MTGSEIAEWRKKNKWSQTQVVRAVGTDQSIVSKWERGLIQPPDDIRVQLTAALAKKQRAYEKAGGLPAAAPLPELKGRNAHDNAAERNWRNEQQQAYKKNDTIRQAAELAAGARMDEIRKELEEEKEMPEFLSKEQTGLNIKPQVLERFPIRYFVDMEIQRYISAEHFLYDAEMQHEQDQIEMLRHFKAYMMQLMFC